MLMRWSLRFLANPAMVYCKRCYRSWNRYYQEKQCHLCGSDHPATLNKPACPKCYRKHKKVLTFPTGQA